VTGPHERAGVRRLDCSATRIRRLERCSLRRSRGGTVQRHRGWGRVSRRRRVTVSPLTPEGSFVCVLTTSEASAPPPPRLARWSRCARPGVGVVPGRVGDHERPRRSPTGRTGVHRGGLADGRRRKFSPRKRYRQRERCAPRRSRRRHHIDRGILATGLRRHPRAVPRERRWCGSRGTRSCRPAHASRRSSRRARVHGARRPFRRCAGRSVSRQIAAAWECVALSSVFSQAEVYRGRLVCESRRHSAAPLAPPDCCRLLGQFVLALPIALALDAGDLRVVDEAVDEGRGATRTTLCALWSRQARSSASMRAPCSRSCWAPQRLLVARATRSSSVVWRRPRSLPASFPLIFKPSPRNPELRGSW